MTVAAIVVAAGAGTRLGAGQPKAFVPLDGVSVLQRAAGLFAAHPQIRDLVVVAPEELRAQALELVPDAVVVAGGATRQQSVACGLLALDPQTELVLIHDAARALVPAAVIDRVIGALRDGADAVVPVIALADSIRRVSGGPVDRDELRAVQTPQGFRRSVIDAAHAAAHGDAALDDASLVEAIGHRVELVDGAPEAFKITRPIDLVFAEALLSRHAAAGAAPR